MPSHRYQIRNSLLEILGEFSKREILSKIHSGSFTGEEEIAAPPFRQWQKLAAHPAFYDAFIKRLYSEQYRGPEEEESYQSESEPAPPANEAASSTGPSDETHREIPVDASHLMRSSEIDAMFGEESGAAGKTDILVVSPPADPSEPAPEAPEPVPSEPQTRKGFGQRRIRISAIALVVILAVLWLWRAPPSEDFQAQEKDRAKGPVLGSSATREEKALTLGDEAAFLIAQDTQLFYEGAYRILKEALEIDSGNSALLGKLAITIARLAVDAEEAKKKQPDLEQTVQQARSRDPHSSELYRAEAILAQKQGNLEQAKAYALKAAEADPVSAANLLLIGELHLMADNLGEARSVLAEAVKADPSQVRARYYLALADWKSNDTAAAHESALEALKLNPLHPPSYQLMGDIAARQNQFDEARGLYETCGRLARFTTPQIAGEAYFRLGELHEMAGHLPESQNSYQLAYYYLKGGGPLLKQKVKGLDVSAQNLKTIASQAEYGGSYFAEQGEGLLLQGKTEEAVRFFQAAQLLEPNEGRALIRLGEVMEKTASSYEDFRRVMNYYQQAIDRDPKQAMGYIRLGLLESEQYNFKRGLKLLTQALALDPDSEKPYLALGKHYYKRQDYSEALNYFLKAAKINPTDSEILYYAGKLRLIYKRDGERDAARFFSQAYTMDPKNYDALAEWLKLKVLTYEKNFAIRFVSNLIAAQPSNPQLFWVLGEVYAENKEYRRAIEYYHKSLDLDNRQSKVRMSLAKALEAVGELEKSVAEYRLSSLLDRRNSDGFYRAADLLFQMKAYDQAEEVLRFLMKVTPNYPGVHRYLSKLYQLRKQKDKAIEEMRQEVANNPQNYRFVLELGELLLEYGEQDQAAQELKRVTNLPPSKLAPEFRAEKIRAYLLLARSYREKKRLESAEASIHLALGLDPEDPELHRELGYVYYAMQRDQEGVKEFQYYLDRNPAAQDSATIRGLIKKMVIEE